MTNRITIEGIRYSKDDFLGKELPLFFSKSVFHSQLALFLKDWFSDSSTLPVQTSGSTGKPKKMLVSKEKMLHSAQMTCSFLKLKENDKALLCLPLDYIAGKMMVIRSIFSGLDLYLAIPDGHPLAHNDTEFDFAAMIPLQVSNSLKMDKEKKRLQAVKSLIIGGGTIDEQLVSQLSGMPNAVYSTYGMTETLSHIALRRLSGKNKSSGYTLFPSISISLDNDNALIIDAPLIAEEKLYTNDIVQINEDGSFNIIGRKDNIINSGGIKIQAETVESELRPFLKNIVFAISALPDKDLGEIIVLIVEKTIDESIFQYLPKYHRPRKTIVISKIPLTETGKINRKQLKLQIIKGQTFPDGEL